MTIDWDTLVATVCSRTPQVCWVACRQHVPNSCGGVQAVAVMADLLLDALRNTRTSPAEATDACKHLLQLQAEGSPCMEHCDPIQLYLTTQVRQGSRILC